MQAAHQYAMLFPAFARGEITALEIDSAKVALEDAINSAISEEREACAMACEKTGESPSLLWQEPVCWTQASETCAFNGEGERP